jgi:hypothetical protein
VPLTQNEGLAADAQTHRVAWVLPHAADIPLIEISCCNQSVILEGRVVEDNKGWCVARQGGAAGRGRRTGSGDSGCDGNAHGHGRGCRSLAGGRCGSP